MNSPERFTQSPARQLFFNSAYALILNTGITGALGLAFWMLAAHSYRDPDVGRGSAAISALVLLSGVVTFTATGSLNRFIPVSGRQAYRVVAGAYAAIAAATAAVAATFVSGLDSWGGPVFDLVRQPGMGFWFVAAAVALSLCTVQDSVLTALRATIWVPLWNAGFGAGRIVLLVSLVDVMPTSGVFFASVLPMFLVLIPMTLLIFGWLVPRYVSDAKHAVRVGRAEVGRFFAADYVGALCQFAVVFGVPVLVASHVPPHTYAYFFLAWSIANILSFVAMNFATSLAVEGAYDARGLATNCRSALGRALVWIPVAAVAISLAAPYTLGLLGKGYLDAVALLQLLVFAAIPGAVVDIYVGTLRARTMGAQIARTQLVRGVLVLVPLIAWMVAGSGQLPITIVGVFMLMAQLLTLSTVLPGLWSLLSPEISGAVVAGADEVSGTGGALR